MASILYHGGIALMLIVLGVLSDAEKALIERLFVENNVQLYQISLQILRSHADAEEAVAQTFLKLMDRMEKSEGLPCPQMVPYCVVMVKNESINILRKRKKGAPFEAFESMDEKAAPGGLEDDVLTRVSHEQLLSCVARLSEEDRLFLQFRYANELGYKELAALFEISEEAAKKRGQRILKKLRVIYERGIRDAVCTE